MKRVHIVGRKNSGKTTLIVELVQHLASQGFRVGTIKHTHHDHELDTPGKDSHQHREAGSSVVGIVTRGMTAVFQPTEKRFDSDESRYAGLAPMFAGCDLVLVEGDLKTAAPRVEVWRKETLQSPISVEDRSIAAIIGNDIENFGIPVWNRCELGDIAANVLRLSNERRAAFS